MDEKDNKKPAAITTASRMTVVNVVQPNPVNPIPFQRQSLFYVPSGKSSYIPFFSDTDRFPNLLLESRLNSPTQTDCIDTIKRCVVGNGIYVIGNDKPDKVWKNWIASVNNHGNSLNKVLQSVVDGFETQGNKFVEIVRGEVGSKRYVKLYPHPMQDCRLVEPGVDNIPIAVYVSKYFSRTGSGLLAANYLKKARQVPIWTGNSLDNNWLDNGDGSQSTMIHLKNEIDGVDYYGLPASAGSLLYQVQEALMAQFNNDNLNNSMVPGGILGIKGSLSRDEVAKVAADIVNTHTGRGKVGRWAVVASEAGGVEDIKMEQFKTEKEGSYIEADRRAEERIASSHKIPAELRSLNSSAGLGKGGAYLLQVWLQFEAMKLAPIRQEIIEELLNKVNIIFAEWMGIAEVARYDYGFHNPMSLLAFITIDPATTLTINEQREMMNLPEDKDFGNLYPAQLKTGGQQNVQR